jgi:hypothetical protein
MERDWNFYIAVHSMDQVDELLSELKYLKCIMKSVIMHEDGEANNLTVELKSRKYSKDSNDDIFDITIRY